jgi:predicted SprT family Zn-dependent metalloprotease
MTDPQALTRTYIAHRMNQWGRLWGIPNFGSDVLVVFSKRLRTTLARCRPAERRIVLREDLSRAARARLTEVLCHEAAHVAVHKVYGHRAKPHGAEWKRLVCLAGFRPTIRSQDVGLNSKRRTHRTSLIYQHRCPVCQMMRMARRAVPTWRCSECLDAGLGGVLIITCVDPSLVGHLRGG